MKKVRVLHVCVDDQFLGRFFIPNATGLDLISKDDFFLIYSADGTIKNKLAQFNRVKYVSSKNLYEEFVAHLADKIIIHCCIPDFQKLLIEARIHIKSATILSLVYGFEMYHYFNNQILLPQTNAFRLSREGNQLRRFKSKIYSWRSKLLARRAFSYVDSIVHYIPSEFETFKNALNFKGSYLEFNMGYLSQVLDLDEDYQPTSNNILLGNSGNITNNHLDLIESSQNFSNHALVYCPLSYSVTSDEYLQKVIEAGRNKFGERFIPLIDFMPTMEYNRILNSCSKIVMGHLRSQGGASVWSALYRGSDLFMHSKNPLYPFFTKLGANILSIDKGIDFSSSLSDLQRSENREVLVSHFSDEKVKNRYYNLLNF